MTTGDEPHPTPGQVLCQSVSMPLRAIKETFNEIKYNAVIKSGLIRRVRLASGLFCLFLDHR